MTNDPQVRRRAVVTGGTSAVGRAITDVLTDLGPDVQVWGRDRDAPATAAALPRVTSRNAVPQ